MTEIHDLRGAPGQHIATRRPVYTSTAENAALSNALRNHFNMQAWQAMLAYNMRHLWGNNDQAK